MNNEIKGAESLAKLIAYQYGISEPNRLEDFTQDMNRLITQVRAEKDSEALKLREEIAGLQDALLKIRVAGGLEAEMARCFDLVIKRDEEISKHKAALGRMREALESCVEHFKNTLPSKDRPTFSELEEILKRDTVCLTQIQPDGSLASHPCIENAKKALTDPISESAWREWKEKPVCPHNNITTHQTLIGAKISSFCDDCKIRLYPETEAIDELHNKLRNKDARIKSLEAVVSAAREIYESGDFIAQKSNPQELARARARGIKLVEALYNLDNRKGEV